MNICDEYIHSPWEDLLGKSTVIRRQLDNDEMKSRNLKRNKCIVALRLRWPDVYMPLEFLWLQVTGTQSNWLKRKGIYWFKQLIKSVELTSGMT